MLDFGLAKQGDPTVSAEPSTSPASRDEIAMARGGLTVAGPAHETNMIGQVTHLPVRVSQRGDGSTQLESLVQAHWPGLAAQLSPV